MKISRIHIDGYGMYHDYVLGPEYFSKPIICVHGPNETGKTTLHSFIRSVLFGFRTKDMPMYEPLHGGRLGGSVTLINDQGEEIQILRRSPPKKGKVTLHLEDGRQAGEMLLKQLLGHVSAPLFMNIFAFTHHELRQLQTLQDEEISAFLYSAAMGTGAVNLLDIEKKMQKSQEQLFKPRASNPPMNQLLTELEEQEQEIRAYRQQMEQYAPLNRELQQTKQRLNQLRMDREEMENRRKRLERVQEGWQFYKQIEDIERQYEQVSTESIQLHPFQVEIQSLLAERTFIKEEENKQQQLTERIRQCDQQLEVHFQYLGENWTQEKVKEQDVSIPAKERLLQLASKKQRAKETVDQLSNQYQDRKDHHKHKRYLWIAGGSALGFPSLLISADQLLAAVILFGVLGYTFGRLWLARRRKDSEQRRLIEQIKDQKKELKWIHSEWEREMKARGISPLISLSGLEDMIRHVQDAKELIVERERLLQQRDRQSKKIRSWSDRVIHFAHFLGQDRGRETDPGSGREDAHTLLPFLQRKLAKEEQQIQRQRELTLQQKQLQAQLDAIQSHLDEYSFQADHSSQETGPYQALRSEDEEGIADQLADMKRKERQMLQEMEELAGYAGKLEAQLYELEAEDRLSYLQQEFAEKKEAFRALAKEWGMYALGRYLCTNTRKVYEEERQPMLLQKASLFLDQMTAGRYRQIIAPMDRKDLLVVRQDGSRLYSTQLSQGTKEQLYLSMRFAFIQEYGKVVKLPVIMDDILVNFDPERLREAIKGIVRLSSTHQVIILTCHPHIMEMLKEVTSEVQCIPLKCYN